MKIRMPFGFSIERNDGKKPLPSFATPVSADSLNITALPQYSDQYIDLEGINNNERELITRYRTMSMHPEMNIAINDIVDESITLSEGQDVVSINLDKISFTDDPKKDDQLKDIIRTEFNQMLYLLNFDKNGWDIFKRWYIDGRLYFHNIVDEDNPQRGILELRYLDPRKIKRVREFKNSVDPETGATIKVLDEDYYLYNDKAYATDNIYMGGAAPFLEDNVRGTLRIEKDAITYASSGLVDEEGKFVTSYLHPAIKPLNQLRILEDSVLIYRAARASERRIFYVDVGNMPQQKAEQYVREMMLRHKNRLVYNASSGEIRDDRKMMSMIEDFWIPRRGDNKATQIETLPGGQQLGEIGDIEYFQMKLYQTLNIPISRLDQNQPFLLGRSTEISRDEVKFQKFITRLRRKFSELFNNIIQTQLILKGVMTSDEWEQIEQYVEYNYAKDVYFAELRETDMMRERAQTLSMYDAFIGRYYSQHYVRKNILKQSDEDIRQMDGEIYQEMLQQIQLQKEFGTGEQEQNNQEE